jgi:ascorbate-specific PTS system EIIC-type component UlaA
MKKQFLKAVCLLSPRRGDVWWFKILQFCIVSIYVSLLFIMIGTFTRYSPLYVSSHIIVIASSLILTIYLVIYDYYYH